MIVQRFLTQAGALVSICVLTCCPIGISHAQDNQATDILRAMSDEIAGLDQFIITGDGYFDARMDAGQIIEHSTDVTMRMSRPDAAMRITNVVAEEDAEEDVLSSVWPSRLCRTVALLRGCVPASLTTIAGASGISLYTRARR